MEALSGSWQYEDISSANGIDLSSPFSPTLYGIFEDSPAVADLIFEDSSNNPFIASCGGSQLLSAANNSSPLIVPPVYHYNTNLSLKTLDVGNLDANGRNEFSGHGELQGIEIDLDSVLGLNGATDQPPLDEASVDLLAKGIASVESIALDGAYDTLSGLSEDAAEESFEIEDLLFTQSQIDELNQQGLISSPESQFQDAKDDDSISSGGFGSIHESQDEDMNIDSYFGEGDSMVSFENSSSMNSSDAEDDAQDQTVDALLRNDWSTAQSLVNSFGRHKLQGIEEDPDYKPERRGRKPVSSKSKSWSNVKDKQLRKKQQNKEAATKYRMKKKQEALLSKEIEQSLEKTHMELTREKEKIANDISSIKKLLLEKFKLHKQG